MDIHKVIKSLKLKFTSGNKIQVERNTIIYNEFKIIYDWYIDTDLKLLNFLIICFLKQIVVILLILRYFFIYND